MGYTSARLVWQVGLCFAASTYIMGLGFSKAPPRKMSSVGTWVLQLPRVDSWVLRWTYITPISVTQHIYSPFLFFFYNIFSQIFLAIFLGACTKPTHVHRYGVRFEHTRLMQITQLLGGFFHECYTFGPWVSPMSIMWLCVSYGTWILHPEKWVAMACESHSCPRVNSWSSKWPNITPILVAHIYITYSQIYTSLSFKRGAFHMYKYW